MMMWMKLTAAMATESEIIYSIPPLSALSLFHMHTVRESSQQVFVLQLFVDIQLQNDRFRFNQEESMLDFFFFMGKNNNQLTYQNTFKITRFKQ